MDAEITIPAAIDLEENVLGCLILMPEAYSKVANIIHVDLFTVEENKKIFMAIFKCYEESMSVNFEKVKIKLDKELFNLLYVYQSEAGSLALLMDNVLILKQFSVRRLMLFSASWLMKKSTNMQYDEFDLADKLRVCYEKVSNELFLGSEISLSQQLQGTIDQIEESAKLKSKITGVPTGYIDLDMMTSGFQKGDLIILAARPGMGKSSFALEMFKNTFKKGYNGAFFSLEMKYQNLWQKMFASECRIDHDKLRRGQIKDDEIKKIEVFVKEIIDKSISVYDKGNLGINEFRTISRNLKINNDLDYIIVDYLQLINAFDGSEKPNNREQEISKISRTLKQMAMDLNIPIIALAQLNREVEKRINKRPRLSDLRESGSIEQDADVVMFMYREEMYDPENAEKGLTEVGISKQRNGKLGSVNLTFEPEISRFDDYKLKF